MAAHFKWYPTSTEVIVPFMAQYSFPSQANKALKLTPRIPPKNGSAFSPGQVIRLEFPAQGYVNPLNTTLAFDVTLYGTGTAIAGQVVRFQNNIQSIFNRVRLLYGSTPLEDIINYNVIVRNLTEWTGTGQNGVMDQSTIANGIGGFTYGFTTPVTGTFIPGTGLVNVRQFYIQGLGFNTNSTANGGLATAWSGFGTGAGVIPNLINGTGLPAYAVSGTSSQGAQLGVCTRRYQVNLALGLFTQDKLIPTKFMASQFAIELSLENQDACIFSLKVAGDLGTNPTYGVTNVQLIPEILEFDGSYGMPLIPAFTNITCRRNVSSWVTRRRNPNQIFIVAYIHLCHRFCCKR